MSLLERLGVEVPVVQAGMGGGLSRHELAAAVSEAGGLGTIAVNGAAAIRRELAAARALTARPLAVNVLLPFARRDWFAAAAEADLVVTFWGRPRRRTAGLWAHQCGSVEEALSARAAGADAVIVQGVEAGGHVRGVVPALELLSQVKSALPADYPLWLAGGIAAPEDVRRALDGGRRRCRRRHPLPSKRGEPRPSRIRRAPARRGRHHPHRAVRRRLACSASRHRQRGDRTRPGCRPARAGAEPLAQSPARAGRALVPAGCRRG